VTRPEMRGPIRLGIHNNLGQFGLLVGVNALVGGMIGQERTLLPLLATRVFGLSAYTASLTFILAFGIVKAIMDLIAGTACERVGRRPVLIAGWLAGAPVPLLLIWAPSWGWIIIANVLLGVNQGLTWSTTVIMKIDLAGPARRGLAMGLNEAAGYGALAATALATGIIAGHTNLRPEPFFLGIAYAGLGLGLSTLFVRETGQHARHEAAQTSPLPDALRQTISIRDVFAFTSFRDRTLSASSQAGLVNNLNDALAWGVFPLYFAAAGLSISRIGVLAALYPAVWASVNSRPERSQIAGAASGSSSRACGRRRARLGSSPGPVASSRGRASRHCSDSAPQWCTRPCSPASGDVAHPRWRATAVGVYRWWRDIGFAVGALVAGIVADRFGVRSAIWVDAALTATSGIVVATRMYETHPRRSWPGRAVLTERFDNERRRAF
jgi:MFS family permease